MNVARNGNAFNLVKVTTKILRYAISRKLHSHDICVSVLINLIFFNDF